MPSEQEDDGPDGPNDGADVQTEIRWQDFSQVGEGCERE